MRIKRFICIIMSVIFVLSALVFSSSAEESTEMFEIEILFNTNTVGLFGDNGVEGAHLVKFKGTDQEESLDISIDGFFLAIGHKPNTDVFKQFIDLDEQGYIKTVGVTTATNVPGVFAAGDVADPIYRQAITSAGMGAKAAIDAEKFVISHK